MKPYQGIEHQWLNDGYKIWICNNILYASIIFTWKVNEVISLIKNQKRKAIVGGPGAILMSSHFDNIAEVRTHLDFIEPVTLHNPFATFTTRGCVNNCKFCAVPKIEGKFKEISNFIPRPIICDNNFLVSSKKHFNKVIDSLKQMPYVDFNQGLEAKYFTSAKADRIAELKNVKIRFAFDVIEDEKFIIDAINLAKKKGFKKISCYVLIGFNDTPSDALYRAKLLRKLNIYVYCMRYQPLDSLQKDSYISPNWTDYELKRVKNYWKWPLNIPFEEYETRKDTSNLGFGLIDRRGIKIRKELYKEEINEN